MKKFSRRLLDSQVRQRLSADNASLLDATLPPSLSECAFNGSAKVKLAYGLPLSEDLKAGAISNTIRSHWSNIPAQVRSVMEQSQSTSSKMSDLIQHGEESRLSQQVRGLLALIGKGPADLQLHRTEYCDQLSLFPHTKGMKSAYHWPRSLIPRHVAARCRGDLRLDPVDADRSILLLDQLLDRTSVVLCFSGSDLSGINTGVKAWKNAVSNESSAQVLNVHFCEGWLSRRTHPLTRQILRSFRSEEVEPSKADKMYVYRGKWHRDLVLDFHLYNKSLPSILLVDKKGYVRWHAVGLPSDDSLEVMLRLLQKLVREKH